MLWIVLLLLLVSTRHYGWCAQMEQASRLTEFRVSRNNHPVSDRLSVGDNLVSRVHVQEEKEAARIYDEHLIKNGLPGQPASGVNNFKQFAGEIIVDESSGRSLFYYFVESTSYSSMKPLILWLNGGPGCSSLGIGALTEIGPFGVNPDGKTLYARNFSWNQVANILFLESPAGVGFSYSNTTSDYNSTGDTRTAEDTYIFLLKWFERYPMFKGRNFYLTGESYAGYYIPELADTILQFSNDTKRSTHVMNLKGVMIGNGLIDDASDTKGSIDFMWSHALVSDETHEEFSRRCTGGIYESKSCSKAYMRVMDEISNINSFNIYSPVCQPSLIPHRFTSYFDPCDLLYVQSYLNLPKVQVALHANKTKLQYPWEPCSSLSLGWKDSPSSMFPVYKRLMAHGLRILLYSGDVDAIVPVTSSRYALARMGLKVIEPWHWWNIHNSSEVAGYEVVYDGLTYLTVLGAGHEVSRSHPDRLYALLNNFLSDS